MRITVNLSHYFTDHRSKAKIYIKENMKYIQDIQRRISKIFEIDNFYLNCENHYLPPLEDIKLLNYDDVVWAIPISENKPIEQDSSASIFVETEEVQPRRTQKKKKSREHEVPTAEIEINKKQKRKSNKHTSSEDKITNEQTVEEISPAKDKNEDSVFKDSGRDSLDSSKSDELSNEATCVNVKSLVDTFENKIDFKKHIEQLNKNITAQDTNKRVNIVKTIIVRDSSTDCNANLNVPTKNEVYSSPHVNIPGNITELKSQIGENVFETPENKLIALDSSGGTSRLDTTGENSCNSSVESGSFKKRRIRVRKRKRTNKALELVNTLQKPTYDLIPRPLLKAQIPRHVRFEEESNKQENGTVIVIDDSETKSLELQHKVPTSKKMVVEDPLITTQKNSIEKELTEEFILKQPIMQNMQPRQGDIVAFRILRISEKYTPEVSSRIVGKISSFNPASTEVIMDIMSGQDQCVQPQGKFALDTEDVTEEKNSNHYNCTWSDLLEPRLLYP